MVLVDRSEANRNADGSLKNPGYPFWIGGMESTVGQRPPTPPLDMLDAATARIQQQKFITIDYQHVEGTSFAAPITTSVAAQMLEVDPTLTPRLVREGLTSTARHVSRLDPALQGAGLLQPLAAVRWAEAHRRSKSEHPHRE